MKQLSTILAILFLTATGLYAQKGTIRGTVFDDASSETILGATIVIAGTSIGTVTDMDGKFELKADAGTYNLEVSYITYKTLTIEGVVVEAGKVVLFENIRMKEDVETLAEVVITAEVVQETEEALMTVKQRSVNLLDGISSASFRKIGDSDAASAVKRVPGVSIEGGKYVYVRGLGDRYTKSTMNGVDIPGLDPDRNTVQMDIFPTNVIDNIVVLKSFTADLPADFTGGIVDLATKNFPDERVASLSISGGFNPSMHFNQDYLTYKGGSTDFLGFDDGARANPAIGHSKIPFRGNAIGNPAIAQEYTSILGGFNPTLAAQRQRSGMDFGLGFSLGNQLAGKRITWGYNVSVTYKNDTEYYSDVQYARYGKEGNASITTLDPRELQTGSFGKNDVLLGGLAGIAMKTKKLKVRLNMLHLQNGESKAGVFQYKKTDQGTNFEAIQNNLEYSQRGLTNLFLHGQYRTTNHWGIELKLAGTKSTINDPDIRFTRYRTDNGNTTIGTESGLPERIWRALSEYNLVSKLDLTKDYNWNGREGKVKFGGGYIFKQRSYEIQNFQINPGTTMLTGDPNELFLPANLWSLTNQTGVYYDPQFLPINPNAYDSDVSNSFFYVSNELKLSSKLNTIIGLRAEQYTQRYTGINQSRERFNNSHVLDDLNFFPSVNVIYALKEKQNLRFSFSQTIARPSFKEASFATIVDPITGRTFIGGLFPDIDVTTGKTIWDGKLKATNIMNFDLRWEAFQERGQTLAVSAFYKAFTNPIEMIQYVQAANNFQARNVGNGKVLGIELELRKQLSVISPALKSWAFQSNLTWTTSSIQMSATEYTSRVNNAREGESVKHTRNMAGQAPYIINAGFVYTGSKGLELGMYYNVQGRTLQFVGIADRPDIFSVPFNALNFTMNKTFGADERVRLGFKVSNILGDKRQQVFSSYGSTDRFFSSMSPGTSFGFNFSYSL